MSIENLTRQGSGALGNSVVVSTNMCSITALGFGRWKIWGQVRHTQEDGVKIVVSGALVIPKIPQAANQSAPFGPLVIDVTVAPDSIFLQNAVATGATDTCSGIVYAQRVDKST